MSNRRHVVTEHAFDGMLQRIDYYIPSEERDLRQVLLDFRPVLEERILRLYRQYKAIKVALIITIQYQSLKFRENPPFHLYLRTSNNMIYQENEVGDAIDSMSREIMARNENHIRNESNLRIERIYYVTILFSRFAPLAGRHYIALPAFLQAKRAIMNVQNHDDRCFAYAILSALYPDVSHPERANSYLQFLSQEGLNEITYPVLPCDIAGIEEQLDLKINLFSFFDDEGKGRFPIYVSKRQQARKEIDLLYWGEHYGWIKRFSAFIYDLSPSHSTKWFCKRCFGVFLSTATFERHQEACRRPDYEPMLYRFPPPQTKLKFRNVKNQLRAPFVIVADFECLLEPENIRVGQGRRARTKLYSRHVPCAAAFYIVSTDEQAFESAYFSYTGEDCCKWFLEALQHIIDRLIIRMRDTRPMCLSEEEETRFQAARACWICQKDFAPGDCKVRDHDHFNGKFRGAAHSNCNL